MSIDNKNRATNKRAHANQSNIIDFKRTDVRCADVPKLIALRKKIQLRVEKNQPVDRLTQQFKDKLTSSREAVKTKKSHLPTVNPVGANNSTDDNHSTNDLPVTKAWQEIAQTIADNPVTIVCGHTGSGKTTKLPQICLSLGLGARGKIAHTQPRRLAARSVAARIAEELAVTLGQDVGYKVRFDEKQQPQTTVLLQTDGMLLAEIQQDKWLSQYEVIIVDEAHERSLNIDFLLGYLRQLLPKRPDLKVIITSATIDPERFSKHFNQAPIIMVEGKTYPIETLYMPASALSNQRHDDKQADTANNAQDLSEIIGLAQDVLDRKHYGDTLVFLPTERDIRDTAELLEKKNLKNTEILPLFSRQSPAEQNRIFHPSSRRRIILATNVAETSVTVPRIINVIDTGLARISRYSHRTKIQHLPVEPISQASADQRKGRCGRIAPGVCVRLYEESDFLQRPLFTDPEIKRTSLASVILQMSALNLGNIKSFPFVDAPEYKMIRDGYRLLYELKAVDENHRITDDGKKMAQLPIDPRFAQVLLYAKQHGVLAECLPIICGLVVGDIKVRPLGDEVKADQIHRYLAHKHSDFMFYVSVFNALYPIYQQSRNKAYKWMKKQYLSVIRSREWLALCEQIAQYLDYKITLPRNDGVQPIDKKVIEPVAIDMGQYQAIHSALLTGFLDHLGDWQESSGVYLGARNKQFSIFPGSKLFNKRFKHVMAAEIVESSRVYARQVAKIDFAWVAPLAKHLTKDQVAAPYWSRKQGNVMAKKTVLLYGLPLLTDVTVPYGKTHPEGARDIFIRHALVENAINTTVPAIAQNRQTYEDLLALEEKSRTRDIVIDELRFAELYEKVIPADVYSESQLKAWYQQLEKPDDLVFSEADFTLTETLDFAYQEYPDSLVIRGQQLKLSYEFSPGSARDGVTVYLPLANLNHFEATDFDYLVPAMRLEKVTALIKSLPKQNRRQFVPVAPLAERIVDNLEQAMEANQLIDKTSKQTTPLITFVIEQLKALTSIQLREELFSIEKLDNHCLMNIALVDEKGQVIDESRDFEFLKNRHQTVASENFQEKSQKRFAEIFTETFPSQIPSKMTLSGSIIAYPALNQVANGFQIKLFDHEGMAMKAHQAGVEAFLKHQHQKTLTYVRKRIFNDTQVALYYRMIGGEDTLTDDAINALVSQLVQRHCPSAERLPRNRQAFDKLSRAISDEWVLTAEALNKLLDDILTHYYEIKQVLKPELICYQDVQQQLAQLIYPGFIALTDASRLPAINRYLQGIRVRMEKCQLDPKKDTERMAQLAPFVSDLSAQLPNNRIDQTLATDLQNYAYQIEEFRLSLFAQGKVVVDGKISEKRLSQLQKQLENH